MIPWNKLNDFLLKCGEAQSPRTLGMCVLDYIGALVPFDQGRLYFLKENGDVEGMHLVGIAQKDVEDYFAYYSESDNGAFSVKRLAFQYSGRFPDIRDCIRDPGSYRQKRIAEYVSGLGIKYSFGLGLWNAQGELCCLYSLDRACDIPYSEEEKEIVGIVFRHLNNLYRNFYIAPVQADVVSAVGHWDTLTKRETEIAHLLLKGVTPDRVGEKLCISFTTVNKHIANMHRKLHVSTRQELIVRLNDIIKIGP